MLRSPGERFLLIGYFAELIIDFGGPLAKRNEALGTRLPHSAIDVSKVSTSSTRRAKNSVRL